jgi:prolyl-tRNA synthetase
MSKLPDINHNFAEWYQEVVYQAELADHAPVRGCMVIRPYGQALWENIRDYLDKRIKETGHENAAFPLLIPESFLKKEASHVAGFSPELAVVTHAGGKELEEPLVVRPTSETIIHYMFARWIKSWRDLPLKVNQWCSVVRWEMRTRPFLRTTEFFWHEVHTAHETEQEALEQAYLVHELSMDMAHAMLAIPAIGGIKSDMEKFPGADLTISFEGMMQDGKALQMGTSHVIAQSFAKAFEMKFQDREGNLAYPFLTSWCGLTTRAIGALIMVHGDQKGLVLPPNVAPIQVVIIPIFKQGEDRQPILDAIAKMKVDLGTAVRVIVDDDDQKTPGSKFYKWEIKGVPLRIEIGPRDVAAGHVMMADRLGLEKKAVALDQVGIVVKERLEFLQRTMLERAKERMAKMWYKEAKLADFGPRLAKDNGFYQTGWCQNQACELKLKEFQASTRCLLKETSFKSCFNCDAPSKGDVVVAKAY